VDVSSGGSQWTAYEEILRRVNEIRSIRSGQFYYRVTKLSQFLDLSVGLFVGQVIGYGSVVIVGNASPVS